MARQMQRAKVISQKKLADGIFDLVLFAYNVADEAHAGQFVSVYADDESKLLPRPISLCGIDRDEGEFRLVYRVTGEHTGTEWLSRLRAGDSVKMLGPLGNGFTVLPKKRALLVGGGIGIPPMLALARDIKSGLAPGIENKENIPEIKIVAGYRDKNIFLFKELKKEADSFAATEDGSVGTCGNALDAIRENNIEADAIYACGPMPMLRALKNYAAEKGMDCFISLEERMACGIGACLACVCATENVDAHSNVNNKRICKDGPVFDAREVLLD
ncbi:MAG: dihydroorotate dehydrogenase electron transfer subunit [Clostridiales bacterium]|nr:dihydroorotate dehydrogenase electron transfer subunit [Clostridiales bacterium]